MCVELHDLQCVLMGCGWRGCKQEDGQYQMCPIATSFDWLSPNWQQICWRPADLTDLYNVSQIWEIWGNCHQIWQTCTSIFRYMCIIFFSKPLFRWFFVIGAIMNTDDICYSITPTCASLGKSVRFGRSPQHDENGDFSLIFVFGSPNAKNYSRSQHHTWIRERILCFG